MVGWQQIRGAGVTGATTTTGFYLGRWATVMDAELKGIELAWAGGAQVVALDSQGAIERAHQLQFYQARPWNSKGG